MKTIPNVHVIDVTPENVVETGIYCIKNKKSNGYTSKLNWFKSKINHGLKIKIAVDQNKKQLGFIEYIPSELAWRPVNAENYLFIHCIVVFSKKSRAQGMASLLIQHCEQDAKAMKKNGLCVMCSDGSWMANKSVFEKNDFALVEKQGRFELMAKPFDNLKPLPSLIDWTKDHSKYKGWNLIYADQCPWHDKSVTDLKQSAAANGIKLKVTKLKTPKMAQQCPSGLGTFAIIKDGKLLADNYVSKTRFENIIKKES